MGPQQYFFQFSGFFQKQYIDIGVYAPRIMPITLALFNFLVKKKILNYQESFFCFLMGYTDYVNMFSSKRPVGFFFYVKLSALRGLI